MAMHRLLMILLKCQQLSICIEVKAEKAGTVSSIVADKIGTAAMLLGAGRATKDSDIDLAVGIVLNKKISDKVEAGESLATLHANSEDVQHVIDMVLGAYTISSGEVIKPTLIYEEIH